MNLCVSGLVVRFLYGSAVYLDSTLFYELFFYIVLQKDNLEFKATGGGVGGSGGFKN